MSDDKIFLSHTTHRCTQCDHVYLFDQLDDGVCPYCALDPIAQFAADIESAAERGRPT